MIVISVTQNNFQNGPGISDRLLGFYLELGIMVSLFPTSWDLGHCQYLFGVSFVSDSSVKPS